MPQTRVMQSNNTGKLVMNNNITSARLKQGTYAIKVWGLNITPSFIVVNSHEGFWTVYNSLGVSVIRAKTKNDALEALRTANNDDLTLLNNQEAA